MVATLFRIKVRRMFEASRYTT